MSRRGIPVVLLAGALAIAPTPGGAAGRTQDPAQPPSGAAKAQGQGTDERAIAALKETSTALASARTLRFKTRSLLPTKTADGDWITIVGASTVMRAGKDKLFVEAGGDFFPFRFYFDGKTVVAFAPESHVYAQKEAAGTIDEVLDRAAKNGEATFVFAPLVSADPYAAMTKGLQRAIVVGTSTVEGAETEHLAVHGKAVDWEIWIGTKDRLPRMVTLTDKGEARKPTHTVIFSEWAVNEPLPAEAFSFAKPADAMEVPFRRPGQPAAAARRAPPPARR